MVRRFFHARKQGLTIMANKKKTTAKRPSIVKVKSEPQPLGRGKDSPALLKIAPKTYAFRLEPKSKVHAPIRVWGYRHADGWTGWIEELRKTQYRPTTWSADTWVELPANDQTAKAAKLVGGVKR